MWGVSVIFGTKQGKHGSFNDSQPVFFAGRRGDYLVFIEEERSLSGLKGGRRTSEDSGRLYRLAGEFPLQRQVFPFFLNRVYYFGDILVAEKSPLGKCNLLVEVISCTS